MKVRMLNGARGVEKRVQWKEGQDAPPERRTIRNVDFCLGELDEHGEFQPKQAVQRLQFPVDATEREIAVKVRARARELQGLIVTEPVAIDLEVN